MEVVDVAEELPVVPPPAVEVVPSPPVPAVVDDSSPPSGTFPISPPVLERS